MPTDNFAKRRKVRVALSMGTRSLPYFTKKLTFHPSLFFVRTPPTVGPFLSLIQRKNLFPYTDKRCARVTRTGSLFCSRGEEVRRTDRQGVLKRSDPASTRLVRWLKGMAPKITPKITSLIYCFEDVPFYLGEVEIGAASYSFGRIILGEIIQNNGFGFT